ncbi:restriction endonuclease subunit S [Micromonospora aurantiaca (nom. illeg.)]|uniref:restriction endonuclease subunit S n=1 Tax=Micromonospora aurantiaca (nom. illeg.) TaxID=47850 RepID=UPI003EB8E371
MTAPSFSKLADVASINPKLANRPADDELISFIPMSSVDAEAGTTESGAERTFGEVSKGYTIFSDKDVLVAKITPCFENGKIAQAGLRHRIGVGSTEFHVIRPNRFELDARYLLHFLRRPAVRVAGERRMTGSAGQRRVPEAFLADLSIPTPPLPEQKRIAEVLDRVDELRAKRREALAHLDDLTQSIFLDLFGSPSSNPMDWPLVTLGDALAMPLRNGLSPATRGQVEGLVLTLSSVTGQRFDPTARKRATFLAPPPAAQTVHPSDFLICRGNGNLSLVGRGFFPYDPMPDTTFPDTVIAARIQTTTVRPVFLEHVWRSNAVRRQIEALARTTNGTYKVNQTMLESVSFFAPPLPLQDDFVRKIAAVDVLRQRHSSHHAELDALFASLQDRAFRGLL